MVGRTSAICHLLKYDQGQRLTHAVAISRWDLTLAHAVMLPKYGQKKFAPVSNHKSARVMISTEAPPPKFLEVEPGNEASQDNNDILDDGNGTSPMDDVIMMSLGLYSNVWLGLIIIGTQVVEGLT